MSMLSERTYWFILITCLAIFVAVDWLWIIPVDKDVGISLFTDAIFTIFTLVFLTWIVRTRDLRRWKRIEKKVLERTAHHLFDISESILDFFSLLTQESDDFEKRVAAAPKMNAAEANRFLRSLTFEGVANQETIALGSNWKAFLGESNLLSIRELIEGFKRERDFLEHITSEHVNVLSPTFTYLLMEIEDGLDIAIEVLHRIVTLGGYYDVEMEHDLKSGIHRIVKAINRLNKLKLGFCPEHSVALLRA